MTFDAWLAAYLASLDDASLLAHASAAMLEKARGDVAGVTAVEIGESARVTLGANTVELDRGGLAGSRCTCPAAKLVCRHRLAAVLVLRERVAAAAAASPPPAIAWTLETLKHAFGPRLYAKARAALEAEEPVTIERGANLRVELAAGVTCTFSPLVGIERSTCSCRRAFPCEHRAVAALALLVDDGRLELAPKPPRPRTLPGGRDEAEVVADVRALVLEIARVGLDAANASWIGRASRLALVAHAVDLPALERELQALAGQLELARVRSAAADPAAIGDVLARIAWRCRALGGGSPFTRRELAGEHRRVYRDVGTLDLYCLAVAPFASWDGLTGDVLYFHGGGAFHEVLLRRGQTRGALAIWGLPDHRALVGKRVLVEHAKRSADGRLSTTGRAAIGAAFDPCALELAIAGLPSVRRFTLRAAPEPLVVIRADDAQLFGRARSGRVFEPIAMFRHDEPRITPPPATTSPPRPRDVLGALRVWQADVLCAGVATAMPGIRARGAVLATELERCGLPRIARAIEGGLAAPEAWLDAWAVIAVAIELAS